MAAVAATAVYRSPLFSVERNLFNDAKNGNPMLKVGLVTLPATANNSDTTTVDLFKKFGMLRFLAIVGQTHSTANSIVVEEAPTTAVVNNTLTITVGGATGTKCREFLVYGV